MTLKNDKDKISYIIGEDLGSSFVRDGYEIDLDILIEAMKLTFNGEKLTDLTDIEKDKVLQAWQTQMQAKKAKQNQQAGIKAREEGEIFLRSNREKEDVTETPSGLQYIVMKDGNGAKPKQTDTVKVHYHGTLLNGTVFDSSVQRGEPIAFPLNQVIAGWTEGVQLMSVGSKYKFFIPADLAYGDAPVGNIPSGSTLVFEVELLGIQ
jgi:FKBP-type peptidyl-prolyl cis-trans isomerases 1